MTMTQDEYESAMVVEMMRASSMPTLDSMTPQEQYVRKTMMEALMVMMRNTPANWARFEAVKHVLSAVDWMSRAQRLESREKLLEPGDT